MRKISWCNLYLLLEFKEETHLEYSEKRKKKMLPESVFKKHVLAKAVKAGG